MRVVGSFRFHLLHVDKKKPLIHLRIALLSYSHLNFKYFSIERLSSLVFNNKKTSYLENKPVLSPFFQIRENTTSLKINNEKCSKTFYWYLFVCGKWIDSLLSENDLSMFSPKIVLSCYLLF